MAMLCSVSFVFYLQIFIADDANIILRTCRRRISSLTNSVVHTVVGMTQDQPNPDMFEKLLEKSNFQRAIRVAAYVSRFLSNCRAGKKKRATLTVEEIERAKDDWIQRVQKRSQSSPVSQQHHKELNLKENDQGSLNVEKGSKVVIQYIYQRMSFSNTSWWRRSISKPAKPGLTMAAVREKYWIPKLRSLVKRVRKTCWGCKRFQATPFDPPPQATLPTDRVCGEKAFE